MKAILKMPVMTVDGMAGPGAVIDVAADVACEIEAEGASPLEPAGPIGAVSDASSSPGGRVLPELILPSQEDDAGLSS